jgi:ubiquinone biosynthesis protein COQ9
MCEATTRTDRLAFTSNFDPVRTAVAIAGEAGTWDAVRMQDVARAVGVSLAELLREYPDRDALGDACFDAADAAMLAQGEEPAWPRADVCERLDRAIVAWLGALPPPRIVRGILRYKLQPEHVHLQALGVMRISRTVQTLREAALLRATGWRREAEEAALTTIFLATFGSWLFDGSKAAQRTQARLARAIGAAHRLGGWS